MENNQYYYDAYFEFIQYVDEKIVAIEKMHKKDLRCKKKCSGCCLDTTVLPIEFFSILSALKEKNIRPEPSDEGCLMLKKSLCQIYEFRPLICRTHGLPLAYGQDDDPLSKTVTFCELNFTKSVPDFTDANIIDMDEINIELVRLNENFIRSYGKDIPERIPLTELLDHLI